MPLAATTLFGEKNTKYVVGGMDGLRLDPQSLTVHLCDGWYLNAREISGLSKFSVFAGVKKGRKKGVGPFKHHKKIPCGLNVIAVEKTNGWLFFCDSRENYLLLHESLHTDTLSNQMFDHIKHGTTAKKAFFVHVSARFRYSTVRSQARVIISDENDVPLAEPIRDVTYCKEVYKVPEDLRTGMPSQCLCVESLETDKLYDFLRQVQAAGAEKNRGEEAARREQEELRWNQRKQEKAAQLRLERQRKTPEQLEEERQRRNMGRRGEQAVDYVIKWLAAEGYCSVPKKPCVKFDDTSILLWNPDFIDEPQEYDHIVLGPQGVFLIETKNFRGTLVVNPNGNWVRIKDGTKEGTSSPVQQVRRHEKLLRSILPENIPIIPIICMAHPEVIIEGTEHCTIPLMKSDLLGDFIEAYETGAPPLSEEDIQMCLETIERYRQP